MKALAYLLILAILSTVIYTLLSMLFQVELPEPQLVFHGQRETT